ncbi:myosin light chain 3, skeletal muscle isoform-like [Convolutriloba macropyga]|uniref:myosin light chain 3, skeletal muscle isoform-like n=1 Tax=Convolutriloba macropyga TaxID=536237 RepID=UPI003F5211D5
MNHSIDYVQDCFLVFDKVGDSRIDKKQVGDLVRALGLNPTNKDIDRVTKGCSQRMTFEEFVPTYQALEKAESEKEFEVSSFYEGFKVFDTENKGTLKEAELKDILTRLGEKLSEDEANAILGAVVDSDGKVSVDSLIRYVTNTN